MSIFRGLLFLLLIASALSWACYLVTGQMRYRRWGIVILKWAVGAGLSFFAVLGLSRIFGF